MKRSRHFLSTNRNGSTLFTAATALRDAAQRVLSRRFRVVLLVRDAYDRMTAHPNVLQAVWTDLRTMCRLLLRWATRSYRQVSWAPLVVMAGALLYFVTPLDAIPDALGAIGFMDDAAVIGTAVQSVRGELHRFRAWERQAALPE
ncbi:MAG: YkvA family protein [Salinivenus sp.]